MDTRTIVSKFRLSEWGGIVKERISSGQTVSAFCSERGISETTYYYRLKRVREAACKEINDREATCKEISGAQASEQIAGKAQGAQIQSNNETFSDINKAPKSKATIVPNGWAQLIKAEPVAVPESALTIEIAGCQIKVTNDTDTALLMKVCGVLKSL